MQALASRVQAQSFESASKEDQRQAFQRGELDQTIVKNLDQEMLHLQRQLALAKAAKHGPSIASLALSLSDRMTLKASLTHDAALSKQSCDLTRLAAKSWADLDLASTMSHQLLATALLRSSADDEDLRRFVDSESRIYGVNVDILQGKAYDAVAARLFPKLLATAEFTEAIALAKTAARSDPQLWHWLLGRVAGDAELVKLASPVFANKLEFASLTIQAQLDPQSRLIARQLRLFKEDQPQE